MRSRRWALPVLTPDSCSRQKVEIIVFIGTQPHGNPQDPNVNARLAPGAYGPASSSSGPDTACRPQLQQLRQEFNQQRI